MAELDPALIVIPWKQGIRLATFTMFEYPSCRFLCHGQAVEGDMFPRAQRLACDPELAKFTGVQKCSKVAEDIDAEQGRLDRGDLLPLLGSSFEYHLFPLGS